MAFLSFTALFVLNCSPAEVSSIGKSHLVQANENLNMSFSRQVKKACKTRQKMYSSNMNVVLS